MLCSGEQRDEYLVMHKNENKIRLAISGAGRIGRAVFRAFFEYRERFPNIDLVAINDPHDFTTLVHLLRYDSVHGRLPFTINLQAHDCLNVMQGKSVVQLLAKREPVRLAWGDLGVDTVLECTGVFRDKVGLSQHLQAGAKCVVLSAPAQGSVDATIVLGANDVQLRAKHTVISIGSCTTNALAPVLKMLQAYVGIKQCFFTTVHAYTKDQCLVDAHHKDLRRARAAGQSIIPTKTGAAQAISDIFPDLSGRVQGYAVRVPTANVSLLDVVVDLVQPIDLAQIKAHIICFCRQSAYINFTNEPLVSCDFNHSLYSAIIDLSQLQVIGHTVRIVAWYDNEWAYAVRLLDLAQIQSLLCSSTQSEMGEQIF